MENAVDALKMAGAAALFVLALSVAMVMFTKARQTTDAVLDNLNLEDFFARTEYLDNNVTREVGIETVIPTLYRYAQSDANIRIIILDSQGNKHQVFDTSLDSDIISAIQAGPNDQLRSYYNRLLSDYNTPTKPAYLFGAPWANQNDSSYRVERINAYIYGMKTKHMKTVTYDGTNPSSSQRGLLNLIKGTNGIFEETYLEYNINGQVEKDEYGEEIVTIPASVKTIITYELKR